MINKEEILINAIRRLGKELIEKGEKYTNAEMFDECVQNLSVSIFETEFSNNNNVDVLVDKVISSTFDTLHNLSEISTSITNIKNRVDINKYFDERNKKMAFLSMNKFIGKMVDDTRYQKKLSLSIYEKQYLSLIESFDDFISGEINLITDTEKINEREHWNKGLTIMRDSLFNVETCDGYKSYLSIPSDECFVFLKNNKNIISIKKYFACKTQSKDIDNNFYHILFALTHITNDDLRRAYNLLSSKYIYMTYDTWVSLRTNIFDPFYFINPLRIFAIIILSCKDVKCLDDKLIITANGNIRNFINCITRKYGPSNGILPTCWRGDKFYENIHTFMSVH